MRTYGKPAREFFRRLTHDVTSKDIRQPAADNLKPNPTEKGLLHTQTFDDRPRLKKKA